jgi:hypothetical protein
MLVGMRHAWFAALFLIVGLLVAPRVARAGDGKSLFPLVGDDVRTVAVIDLAHARDSSAFQKVQALLIKDVEELAKLTASGIDLSKIDTVLFAKGKDDAHSILIATGSFTASDVDSFATTMGDTKAKRGSTTYWSGTDFEIAMLGKRMVLTPTGGMNAVIDRLKKKARTLARSSKAAAIRAAIAMTDTRHDVWIASGDDDLLGGDTPSKGVSIGLSLTSDVVAQARIQMNDATTAATAQQGLSAEIDQVRTVLKGSGLTGFASSIAVDVDDDVIQVGATLPAGEVDSFLALIERFY